MSPEERQMLTGLFDRIRGAAATPRDPEAEALISDAVRNMPYAPYLLAQAVIVQDQALQAANGKLQEQEARLNDLEQQIGQQPRPAAGAGGFLGGLGSIFGSGGSRPAAEPPPASVPPSGPWGQQASQPSYQQPYAPPPPSGNPWAGAPGMGGQMGAPGMGNPGMGAPMGGGGFLHGALGAAAGVAGGVLLADSIRGLFGAHNNPLGISSGQGGGLGGGLGGLGGGGLDGAGLGGIGSVLGTSAGGGTTVAAPTADKAQNQVQADSQQADAQPDDTQDASYDDTDNDDDSSDDSDGGDDGSYDV